MRTFAPGLMLVVGVACSVPDKSLTDGGAADIDAALDARDGDSRDTTPPDTTITAAPAAADNSVEAAFEFTSTEVGSTFACALDGAGFTPCPTPKAYAALSGGAHTFKVHAIDLAGNVDPTPAEYAWTIDTSSPNTTIDSGPSGAVNTAAAAFGFSSTNAGAGASYECRLDAEAFAACPSPKTYAGLAEGAHGFEVRVRSAAGVVDPTPATRAWTIDVTAPDTTITGGPSGPVASDAGSFALGASEANATFQCKLDAAAYAPCGAVHALSSLAQGNHTLLVQAIDAAGNVDPTPAPRAWSVDTLPPDTTITAKPPAQTNAPGASFAFASEAGATFQCSVDGAAYAACPSPTAFTVGEGNHTIDVRAVDAVGNLDATPATWAWTLDSIVPTTTITTHPLAQSTSSTATFGFSSNEPTATFECKLDSAAYAACPASHTINALGQGAHALVVRAVDLAGNKDATPSQWSWSIDGVAPETTIASGPSSPTQLGMTSFDFASNEGGVNYECSLDGAPFADCPDPFTSWIDDGAHTLKVRARDGAGNVDPTPASYAWTTQLANLVFVVNPSTTNLGGLSGADNVCAQYAEWAGFPGTYRAWLSTSTVNAIDRLGSARGWIRPDGKPFADTAASLAAGKIFYPPNLYTSGASSTALVVTGTAANGKFDATNGSCQDWTTTNGTYRATAGWSSGTTRSWTQDDGATVGCGSFGSIYCLGIDHTTPVAAPTPTGRRAFLSATTWTPGGGLASADATCASEATAAGLGGTFKAALATSTAGALARFASTGTPWVRVDGVAITATAAALFDPSQEYLDSPLNVTAAGAYLSGAGMTSEKHWAGPRLAATTANCADWTDGTFQKTGATGFIGASELRNMFAGSDTWCGEARRLLCFQQ